MNRKLILLLIGKNKKQDGKNLQKTSPASSIETAENTFPYSRPNTQPRIKPKPLKIEKDENGFNLRMRYNRSGSQCIDRFLQMPNSTNPFDNSFNEQINFYNKIFKEDFTYSEEEKVGYKNLYDTFLKHKLGEFILFTDSDDEDTNFNEEDQKKLSNEKKTFLKNKRSHAFNS